MKLGFFGTLPFAFLLAQSSWAEEFKAVVPEGAVSSNYCVDYSNIGTKPGYLQIVNSCGKYVTAEIEDRDRHADIVIERTYHLETGETRTIGLIGYSSQIVDVTPWGRGRHCDDGFGKVSIIKRTVDAQQEAFTVKNHDSGHYLALQTNNFHNGKQVGWSYGIIGPGTSNDRWWGGLTSDNMSIALDWSCVEP